MQAVAYMVSIINPDFPVEVSAETSPNSELILIITFHKKGGEKLCSAVLLPESAGQMFQYETGVVLYPIFSPNAEVTIQFGYHVDTIAKKYTMLAFITTRSQTGETLTRVHGLG
jgi:hypothetical protein